MKQILSAKLQLNTSPEQFQALRRTQLAYRDGLNAASNYAFAHGKTSSNQTLHRGMYEEFVETILTGWWTTCLEILPARERARGRF